MFRESSKFEQSPLKFFKFYEQLLLWAQWISFTVIVWQTCSAKNIFCVPSFERHLWKIVPVPQNCCCKSQQCLKTTVMDEVETQRFSCWRQYLWVMKRKYLGVFFLSTILHKISAHASHDWYHDAVQPLRDDLFFCFPLKYQNICFIWCFFLVNFLHGISAITRYAVRKRLFLASLPISFKSQEEWFWRS